MQNQLDLEKIDPAVVFDMCNTARERTWKAVEDIRSLIFPGMTEKQAIKLANTYFADHGVRKFWHRTHVRFGESTVLSFNDPYQNDVVLKENDIFYIDVGPVWEGVEGDCGETFVVGDNPAFHKITKDVRILFQEIQELWRQEQRSGIDLYKTANETVAKMGYLLHPSYVKGHRLSEFSHFNYTKLGTGDLEFAPTADRWILEFQICDPSMKYGAFYEDLLS